jgi:hypothetical protein
MWRVACGEMSANRLPEPEPLFRRLPNHRVELLPRFVGHAEAAGSQRLVHVFGRRARQRDLEVVNDPGAIHRERRDVAAPHQVDQHRRHARLDHMRADPPDDAAFVPPRVGHRFHDAPQILCAKNGG